MTTRDRPLPRSVPSRALGRRRARILRDVRGGACMLVVRALCLLAPLWLRAESASAAGAEPAPARLTIIVQAEPHFESSSVRQRSPGLLELRARLVDDVGTPLGGAAFEPLLGELPASTQVTSCAESSALSRPRPGRAGFRTDAGGNLCLWVAHTGGSGALALRFAGDAVHLPARLQIPLHPAPPELHLAFETPSVELNLDQPEQRLTLQLSGAESDSEPLPPLQIAIQEAAHERRLEAKQWLRSGSALSFSISSEQLGAPGPARLLARSVVAAGQTPAQAEAVALRTATVRIEARLTDLEADFAELHVAAHSSAGPPANGWVEVSLAGQALGSSPLGAGQAELHVGLPVPPPLTLMLRYHSDDPWWQPGDATELTIDRSRAGGPARWPWLVLLAPIGYICVRALERPAPRRERKPRRPARLPAPPSPAPEAAARAPGLSGSVCDAHDGQPIAGARVELLLPSLRAESHGLLGITDTQGRFALPQLPEPIPEGARLRVSAPLHSEMERPLPPQGRVDIALVSRRRALLARLVRWARAAGAPWQQAGEPTPAEIANVALRRGELGTARWAEAVEAAAFGDGPVDGVREAALRAREPTWQHGSGQADAHEDD